MKSAVFLCTAVAVAALSVIGADCIQSVPKWVDEAKLAYAAEVKSSLATPVVRKEMVYLGAPLI